MRSTITVAALVAAVLAITVAAVPRGGVQNRVPIKYGDRFNKWVGQHFFVQPGSGFIRQDGRGKFKLVRVGLDFVELESGSELLMIPLAQLQAVVNKPR